MKIKKITKSKNKVISYLLTWLAAKESNKVESPIKDLKKLNISTTLFHNLDKSSDP